MCGIAGILRVHRPGQAPPPPLAAIPEAWLDLLDESIRHRGPDGAGRFRDRAVRPDGTVVDVALVHRRLSIIDHAGGAQPMVLPGGTGFQPVSHDAPGSSGGARLRPCPRCAALGKTTIAVVFNGCIYNHRELRRELQAAGHEFTTDHSDTEVLVHGWAESGPAMYGHADAMFATATWDGAEGVFSLARDDYGEKPLYYTDEVGDFAGVAFASSVAALSRLVALRRGVQPVTDPGLFAQWVSMGFDGGTPSWDVQAVGGGTSVTFEARDGNPPSGEAVHHRGPTVTCSVLTPARVDHMLRRAVASRLEADVPLGCFLSGGVDSSLIARYAQEHLSASGRRLETFTVRMPDPRYDESAHAERVASLLGTGHTTHDAEASPAADVVSLIEQLGMPFGDSSLLPAAWVSRAARRHVKVVLSGDGGDEMFLGYDRHLADRWLRRHRAAFAAIPPALLAGGGAKSRRTRLARLTAAARHGGYPELIAIFPHDDLHALIPGAAPQAVCTTPQPQGFWFDRNCYLPDDLLRKTDAATMSVSIEARCPFLDDELSMACSLASESVLMPGGRRKGLLREVARKYFPSEIVDRPKQGFAIPIGEWFRSDFGSMRQLLLDHLTGPEPFGPDRLGVGPMINMAFVKQMLREHDDAGKKSLWPWKGRDHSQRLYMLLVLSIWAKWLAWI